ncbi:MAG TPA: hypothetical protein VL282_07175, partial [Tepidisphaeraceae bacterium]|nr:hypothetical protein [Tepidisphaeraceae bacterium]
DTMIVSGDCVDAQIEGGDGNDVIDCTNNNFTVIVHGGFGDDTIYGSEFDDQLYGDEGSDSLVGNGGNDTFYAGDAGDSVDGGSGSDTLYAGGMQQSNASSVEHIS